MALLLLAASIGLSFSIAARHSQRESSKALSELIKQIDNDPTRHQSLAVTEIRQLMGRLDAYGQAIRDVVRKLQEHATLVAWVIDSLNITVAGAKEDLGSMINAVAQVGEHAHDVLDASHVGVELIENMGANTEDLFKSADTLNIAVENATSSMLQIHAALSGVQQGIAVLAESSDRSTEFIEQVGDAMGSMRMRIEQSFDLSKKVETYAKRGREVVVGVGEGVNDIRESSQAMVASVQTLGKQSEEIEGVLGIITDVAAETSLLSLNAAILAAQAGEKGKAFGVVADQIRSLAQRTRESTKHIEELIRGIQANIARANKGLTANLKAVDKGEKMGREAVQQLELIERAVAESIEQAGEIANATQEQDEKSREMVLAAGKVNESLHQAAEKLGQSTREMESINSLVQELSALSHSVRKTTEDHRETGWKTAEIMNAVSKKVEGIQSLIDKQKDTAAQLNNAVEQVGESSDSTGESLGTIHSIVKEMVSQSDGLREEVDKMFGRGGDPDENEDMAEKEQESKDEDYDPVAAAFAELKQK